MCAWEVFTERQTTVPPSQEPPMIQTCTAQCPTSWGSCDTRSRKRQSVLAMMVLKMIVLVPLMSTRATTLHVSVLFFF